MASRMDRYNSINEESESRLSKNELLYKEISNNKTYTEFTSLDKDNVFEINSNNTSSNRRSNLNRNNIFGNEINTVSNNNNYNSYTKVLEPKKNYNLNEVLEEARKNRSEMEDIDKKKKSVEYSIINDLSQEKIKEYREKKENGITQEEEDNLEELIHTITSNSLRKKIDEELLNDLLPDSDDETDTSVSEEDLEKIKNAELEDLKEKEEIKEKEDEELDDSFYTRSMDLRKEDLVFDDLEEEIDESFKENEKGSVFKNVLITILVIAVFSIIGYVVYRFI